jgi:hypothetical protein
MSMFRGRFRRYRVLLIVGLVVLLGSSSYAPVTASADGRRFCFLPDKGWFCFFEDSNVQGDSIGMSRCSAYFLPTWFYNMTSSWDDNQFYPAYTDVYHGQNSTVVNVEYLWTTWSGGREDVDWAVNDRARAVNNVC